MGESAPDVCSGGRHEGSIGTAGVGVAVGVADGLAGWLGAGVCCGGCAGRRSGRAGHSRAGISWQPALTTRLIIIRAEKAATARPFDCLFITLLLKYPFRGDISGSNLTPGNSRWQSVNMEEMWRFGNRMADITAVDLASHILTAGAPSCMIRVPLVVRAKGYHPFPFRTR
jgi:hypothetical protein